MKKTYLNPTLTVVNMQPTRILDGSNPAIKGTTDAKSGNAGRQSSFSDWSEEE